jgi:hypothetical protein
MLRIATLTLGKITAFDTTVAFLITVVAMTTSAPVMWRGMSVYTKEYTFPILFS